jgi:hypothetical protein
MGQHAGELNSCIGATCTLVADTVVRMHSLLLCLATTFGLGSSSAGEPGGNISDLLVGTLCLRMKSTGGIS